MDKTDVTESTSTYTHTEKRLSKRSSILIEKIGGGFVVGGYSETPSKFEQQTDIKLKFNQTMEIPSVKKEKDYSTVVKGVTGTPVGAKGLRVSVLDLKLKK